MSAKSIVLSKRLAAIAAFVTSGHRVCDIGCDHSAVVISLLRAGISPAAIVIDIHPGPLAIARQRIAEHDLTDQVDVRLGDGLCVYDTDEAETVIITGMGGRLIWSILAADFTKTKAIKELILGPQAEVAELRRCLRWYGFTIIDEVMVEENGKYYPLLKLSPYRESSNSDISEGDDPHLYKWEAELYIDSDRCFDTDDSEDIDALTLADRYGAVLIEKRERVWLQYLRYELAQTKDIIAKILSNECYLSDETKSNDSSSEITAVINSNSGRYYLADEKQKKVATLEAKVKEIQRLLAEPQTMKGEVKS
ncbi:MAG: class I SAM-dependent methyltransferase [Lachnospiraceae bacterium]|jgi:tRNA (adenine22-N1)-methyltransferase|nr:class I SAM-dependent methyltransferase [Lachnospiraceae bacterium]